MLRDKNIGIIFEKENINTLDMQGELLLTIMSSLAQQEVESLSQNVKSSPFATPIPVFLAAAAPAFSCTIN